MNAQDRNAAEPGAPESPSAVGAAGGEAGSLEQRVSELEHEKAEANEKYLRTLADYQNSQRRAAANEREARVQGVTGVILNVLGVVDHFDLALGQDPSKATAESILGGVKMIREELLRVLQNQGVTLINPAANEEFDPHRHQAVVEQQAEGVEPGHVVATLQAGYALGDRVIRPAKVTVKPKA